MVIVPVFWGLGGEEVIGDTATRPVHRHRADRMPGMAVRLHDDEAVEQGGEGDGLGHLVVPKRSEEHTSELQSLMRHSYAVFCLKKQINNTPTHIQHELT